jgi:hypothetical protein
VEGGDVGVGELFREQGQADRSVSDAPLEPVERGGEDLVVVEGQVERRPGIEPVGGLGVVAAGDLRGRTADDGRVGQADRPPARVAARVGEDANELDRSGDVEPGLLAQLAPGASLDRLVDVEEAAGECPLAGERVLLPPDQEDAQSRLGEREDG